MEITSYEILLSVFIFFFGATFASFLGLLSYRVNRDYNLKGILFGRSQCDNCHQNLSWYELIPVFGWIISKGNCGHCGEKITMLYPIYELVLGFIFVLFFLSGQPWYLYIVLSFMYLFAVSDIDFMAIPQVFVHVGVLFTILIFLYIYFLSGSIGSIILGTIVVLSILLLNIIKKSFGIGDLIIIFMISLVLETNQFIIFVLASIILGGVISAMLVAFDKKWLKLYIPFVPFLFLGFIFSVVVNL